MERNQNIELLKEQFAQALDLYKHEDNLNWSKINHLLYINTGLLGIYGFLFDKQNLLSGEKLSWMISFIPIMGIVISVSFGIAIFAGISYLKQRKEQAALIETEIKGITGHHILYGKQEDGKKKLRKKLKEKNMKRSATQKVLLFIPTILAALWVFVLAITLIMYF